MEMDMLVDQDRCQQQMQFVNSIIKHENIEWTNLQAPSYIVKIFKIKIKHIFY